MKIKNKTDYNTQFLRRLFMVCEKHEGTEGKGRVVMVEKTWRAGIHGKAWYNSGFVTIYLPPGKYGPHSSTLVQIYIHEVGHNLGLHHKDMIDWWSINTSWLPNDLNCPIPLKVSKPPKPKPNIVEVRTAKAHKKLDEWEHKLSRAKTFVKKYRTKVRYYEKKMAASNQEGVEQ